MKTDLKTSENPLVNKTPSKGLGDTLARALTGMTLVFLAPCGACKDRQETLNKYFPYKKDK